jgi:hypothetical protein
MKLLHKEPANSQRASHTSRLRAAFSLEHHTAAPSKLTGRDRRNRYRRGQRAGVLHASLHAFRMAGGRVWPEVGIGYDCGYSTPDQIRRDWTGIVSDDTVAALMCAAGLKGEAAHRFVRAHGASVTITEGEGSPAITCLPRVWSISWLLMKHFHKAPEI